MPRLETQAIHAGRRIDPATGAITGPLHLSVTFERDPDGQYSRGFSYSRDGNPNRATLESCLAALEGGTEALVLSSGLAVVTAAVQGLQPGDHVIAPQEVYFALKRVLSELYGRWPIDVSYVDLTNLDALRAAVRPDTRLIWVETPSNPRLRITDLAGVAEIARAANAITICDATFTTPVVQRPFEFGIDMVMHSTTKYLNGHSDAVGGTLITRYHNYLFERVKKFQRLGGAVPSAFDCWLNLRSLETLAYRVRAQCESALKIAAWLESQPFVQCVHYPGLPSHPQQALAARQMTGGFGGMVSIEVKGGRKEAMAVTDHTELFTRATSLGATHSLIEHRASVEGKDSGTPESLLRLSIGLEHPDDLIADLDHALRTVHNGA